MQFVLSAKTLGENARKELPEFSFILTNILDQ